MNLADILKSASMLIVILYHLPFDACLLLAIPIQIAVGVFFFLSGIFWKRRPILTQLFRISYSHAAPYLIGVFIMHWLNPVNFLFPAGSYLWFFWALIIYETAQTFNGSLPVVLSILVFCASGWSSLGWYLLVYSYVYSLGNMARDSVKPMLVASHGPDNIVSCIGRNTKWLYLFHYPLIVVIYMTLS